MEWIQQSTSSDNSQGYFHVILPVSRDIVLFYNTLGRQGLSVTIHHQKRKTLDEASLLSRCRSIYGFTKRYQASPSMAIDRPPLLMAHIDSCMGPNISMCVQRCRCHVCIEQNISNYECNRQTDTHQKAITWQRLFTNMEKTKDKREKWNINKEEVTINIAY